MGVFQGCVGGGAGWFRVFRVGFRLRPGKLPYWDDGPWPGGGADGIALEGQGDEVGGAYCVCRGDVGWGGDGVGLCFNF